LVPYGVLALAASFVTAKLRETKGKVIRDEIEETEQDFHNEKQE
jgi:hypothetical protein